MTDSWDEAAQYCEASIALYSQLDDEDGLASALYVKGYILGSSGKIDQSVEINRQLLGIHQRLGNEIGIAASLTNIAAGIVFQARSEAEALTWEALALRRKQKIPSGIAFSLLVLANEYDSLPSQHVEEAMQIAQKIGHAHHIGMAWLVRCKLAILNDRFDEAEHYLNEAQRFVEINLYYLWYVLYKSLIRLGLGDLAGANSELIEALKHNWYVLENQPLIIIGLGIITTNRGQPERGLSLLSFGLNHLSINQSFADSPLVSRHLKLLQTLLTEEAYASAWEYGKSLTLKAIITELCNEYGIDAPESIKADR